MLEPCQKQTKNNNKSLMPKYFIWDKYEMSQPLIYQLCRESQTIKSSLKCSKVNSYFQNQGPARMMMVLREVKKKKKLREITNIVVMFIARNCYLTLKVV